MKTINSQLDQMNKIKELHDDILAMRDTDKGMYAFELCFDAGAMSAVEARLEEMLFFMKKEAGYYSAA